MPGEVVGSAAASPALAVFVKSPVPGKVKTRLLSRLTPEEAARLYEAFIRDTLSRLKDIKEASCYIACDPSAADPFFPPLGRAYGFSLMDQGAGDLGARMERVLERLRSYGHRRVVLIGSDSPTLPPAFLKRAFEALEKRPLVLGPSPDGGYYLIGLSQRLPALFRSMPWSTPQVLPLTLQRIADLKLSCELLPECRDVDDGGDLQALIAQLGREPDLAPHTRRFLQERRLLASAGSS